MNLVLGGWTGKGGAGGEGGAGGDGGSGGTGGRGGGGGDLGSGGGTFTTLYTGPHRNGDAGNGGNGGNGGIGGDAGPGGDGGESGNAGAGRGGSLYIAGGTMTVNGGTTYDGQAFGGVADLPGLGGDAGDAGSGGAAGAADFALPIGGRIGNQNLWGADGARGSAGSKGFDGAPAAAGDDGASGHAGAAEGPAFFGSVVSSPTQTGDYNNNGVVDAADYVLWRKTPSAYGGGPAGYNTWRMNFGKTFSSGTAMTSETFDLGQQSGGTTGDEFAPGGTDAPVAGSSSLGHALAPNLVASPFLLHLGRVDNTSLNTRHVLRHESDTAIADAAHSAALVALLQASSSFGGSADETASSRHEDDDIRAVDGSIDLHALEQAFDDLQVLVD
jgi:hypothetical protein